MLLGFKLATAGRISLNGINIDNFEKYQLRSRIAVIDNSPLIEGTLREYLSFNQAHIQDNHLMMVLQNLGLAEAILSSEDNLDLRIIPSGWPFLESEKILLKVARALINKAQIIVADEVLDMLEPKVRQKVLHYLTKESQATFIYFSHRYDNFDYFDHKLLVEKTFSKPINNIEEL